MATSGLGHLLVKEGLLTETDRILIRTASGTQGAAFARGVLAIGLLDEEELAAFLAEKTKWRVADKDLTRESRKDAWGAIDRLLVERLEVMPLRLEGDTLLVAMVDPLDRDTIEQLRFFTGCRIKPVIATLSQIRMGLAKLLSDFKPAKSHLEDFLENHALSASQKIRLKQLGKGLGAPLSASASRGEATAASGKGNSGHLTPSVQTPEKIKPARAANAQVASYAPGSPAVPSKGTSQVGADHLDLDHLPLSGGKKAGAGRAALASNDEDLPGELGLELDSSLDSDFAPDPGETSSDLGTGQTTGTPSKTSAEDALTDDDLIFDTDEPEIGSAPTYEAGATDGSASRDESASDTLGSDLLEDDLLGPSSVDQAGDKGGADLAFMDDIPDETPAIDNDADLDTHAVQEIADMDDALADLGQSADTHDADPQSATPSHKQAVASDDDLFDIGALASDFNTIEGSISGRDTPSLTPDNSAMATAQKGAPKAPPQAPELSGDDDLLGDSGPLNEGEDPLLTDTTMDRNALEESPANSNPDDSLLDPLDELGLGTEEASPNIPSLNRFMMTMSLMADPKAAMDKAVPVLIEAGLTRGIVINLTQGESQAILGWGISGAIIERDTNILRRFDDPAGQKWLEAAPRELTVVDALALSGAMVHYAPWIAGGQRQVLCLVTPSSDPARQVAFVTGWEHKGTIDLSLQNMVADIFRKIAIHL